MQQVKLAPHPKPEEEKGMPDDKSKRGSQDRNLISLTQEHEVRYWTKALGVSRQRLEELVHQHGHSAAKIREALKHEGQKKEAA
jgi:Protein of unknown function (DUF3606)